MATGAVTLPPLPEGFILDNAMAQPTGSTPPLPPGFVLEGSVSSGSSEAAPNAPKMSAIEDIARTILTTPNRLVSGVLGAPRDIANMFIQNYGNGAEGALAGLQKVAPDVAQPYLTEARNALSDFLKKPENQPGFGSSTISHALDIPYVLPAHAPQTPGGEGIGVAIDLGIPGADAVAAARIPESLRIMQRTMQETQAALRATREAQAAEAAPSALGRLVQPFTQTGVEKEAGGILRQAATNPEMATEALASYRSPVPGVRPTMAEAGGDTGLAALQRQGIETGNGGAPVADQMTANIRAREDFLNGLSNGPESADTLEGTAQERLDKFREGTGTTISAADRKILENEKALSDQAQKFASSIGNAKSPDVVGEDVRGHLQGLYDDYKSEVRKAYNVPALKQVDPVEFPKDFFDNVLQKADEFYGDAGGFVPADVSALIGEAAEEPQNTRSIVNLDTRLADLAGSYYSRGEYKQSAFIKALRWSFGDLVLPLLSPEKRQALDTARTLRSKQAQLFEEGQLGSVLSRSQYGRYDLGASRVADTLFSSKNAIEAVKQLKQIMGDQGAEEAARAWTSDVFSGALDDNGQFNPKTFARLRSKYSNVLQQFPQIANDFASISKARETLENQSDEQRALANRLRGRQKQTVEQFQRSALGSFLAGKDPDAALAQILNSSSRDRRFSELARQVKGIPEAEKGLRNALINYVRNRANTGAVDFQGTPLPSQKRVADTLKSILPIARKSGLFTEGQTRVMEALTSDIDRLTAAQSAARPRGSETAANLNARQVIALGALRVAQKAPLIGHAIGGITRTYDLLRRTMTLPEVEKTLVKAAQDPKFAARLMRAADEKEAAQLLEDLKRLPAPVRTIGIMPRLALAPNVANDIGTAPATIQSSVAQDQEKNQSVGTQ